MLTPIEYRILTNLRDALAQMQVAAGYHYDVRGTAVKLDPDQDVEALIGSAEQKGPRPFVVIEVRPESREYFPADEVKLTLPWTIHWVNDSNPLQDDDRMETYFRGCADVERAIAADISRGGNAIDTRITQCAFDELDGSTVWAKVDARITLRRTYGQPDA